MNLYTMTTCFIWPWFCSPLEDHWRQIGLCLVITASNIVQFRELVSSWLNDLYLMKYLRYLSGQQTRKFKLSIRHRLNTYGMIYSLTMVQSTIQSGNGHQTKERQILFPKTYNIIGCNTLINQWTGVILISIKCTY